MDDQEKRLKHLEDRVSKVGEYLVTVKNNQRHYLKNRMGKNRAQKEKVARALRLVRWLDGVLSKTGTERVRIAKGRMCLFICTPNQARKLRQIAENAR